MRLRDVALAAPSRAQEAQLRALLALLLDDVALHGLAHHARRRHATPPGERTQVALEVLVDEDRRTLHMHMLA